jgi:MtfA peptidase
METVFVYLLIFLAVVLILSLQERVKQSFFRYYYGRSFPLHEAYYRQLIEQHIAYFHRVSEADQQRWLLRTYLFHRSKRFHYIGIEQQEEMPALISAVAAQLTLGLEKYSLNFFKDIYVLEHDYHYGYYSLPFMGHVDGTGIYLSWDNFLKGVHRADEDSNVGLHEMAHALAYVNFITKSDQDKHFTTEFHQFSKIARPIFQEMQRGRKTLLGSYAATNYHEFWAVSVETFFENPFRFKYELPDLYGAMSKLLKQDPYDLIVNRNVA